MRAAAIALLAALLPPASSLMAQDRADSPPVVFVGPDGAKRAEPNEWGFWTDPGVRSGTRAGKPTVIIDGRGVRDGTAGRPRSGQEITKDSQGSWTRIGP
jgi:hypothetical protein